MEHFKNEFRLELSRFFDAEQVAKIITSFTICANGYELKKQEANLALYDEIASTEHMLDLYLTTRKVGGTSPDSVKQFGYTLRKFFSFTGKAYDQINTNDIRGYLYYEQNIRGLKPQSVEKKREHIGEFYKWLTEEEYINKNPCLRIKGIKGIEIPKSALSRDELETMLSACEDKREIALITTMFSTGGRIAEIAGIKISDINDDRSIGVVGKGHKFRLLHLNARAYRAVMEYLESRTEKSEYLFCSLKRPYGRLEPNSLRGQFNKIRNRIEEQLSFHPTPHTMRRTYATEANLHGMPIELISKSMGHAQLSTTMIYTKISNAQIQQAHQKCIV